MAYSTDDQLLQGCIANDPKAQAALYYKYKGRLLGVCRRYARTQAEAEDIFQDAFVKIFTKIHELKKVEAMAAWIKTVVVNTATDYYRRSLSIKEVALENGDIQMDEPIKEEGLYDGIDAETLITLLSKLPNGYRLVVNMYYLDGFKHQEIALKLGISTNTSKTQLFHAKNWLRENILKMKKNNLLKL